MAPQTRRTSFPKIVIERDTESEESSSSEEIEGDDDAVGQEESSDEEEVVKINKSNGNEEAKEKMVAKKAPITISLKKVCKVCKRTGHEAGFKGATYIDCPMKPCFLCKMPGHTTMACPHRVATEFGVVPAPRRNAHNSLEFVFERQLRPHIPKDWNYSFEKMMHGCEGQQNCSKVCIPWALCRFSLLV